MKLVYFNCQGLAEISRIIMAISGDDYIDYRYPLEVEDISKYQFKKQEFDQDKSDGKLDKSMGKVPYLDFDGQIISQSKAIERFLARKYDLYGNNEVTAARIDAFCESIRDIKDSYFKEKKSANGDKDKWIRDELPNKLESLSKLVDNSENIFGDDEYLFENRLSLADISIYHFITHFFDNKEDSLKAVENNIFKKIITKVGENEKVKNWINIRPKTTF